MFNTKNSNLIERNSYQIKIIYRLNPSYKHEKIESFGYTNIYKSQELDSKGEIFYLILHNYINFSSFCT